MVGDVPEILIDVVLPSLVAGSAENVAQEAFEFLNRTKKRKQRTKTMRNLKHLKEKNYRIAVGETTVAKLIRQQKKLGKVHEDVDGAWSFRPGSCSTFWRFQFLQSRIP